MYERYHRRGRVINWNGCYDVHRKTPSTLNNHERFVFVPKEPGIHLDPYPYLDLTIKLAWSKSVAKLPWTCIGAALCPTCVFFQNLLQSCVHPTTKLGTSEPIPLPSFIETSKCVNRAFLPNPVYKVKTGFLALANLHSPPRAPSARSLHPLGFFPSALVSGPVFPKRHVPVVLNSASL
jgi:hypothetical protein